MAKDVIYMTEDQAIDRLSDMMVELASLEMKRDELNKRIRAKRKEINALAGALNIDV